MCKNSRTIPLVAVVVATLGGAACTDPVGPPAADSPPPAPALAAGTSASGYYNNFYNVQVQRDGFSISVYFQYLGKGSPIFSLGKTANVFNSLMTWVPAKNMNNGFWYAHVANLQPATMYYFRLDDLQSTWSGSAQTYRRQVIVDVNKVHVQYDGDPGAGCGEFIFKTKVWARGPDDVVEDRWSKWHDICTGGDLLLSDTEGRVVDTGFSSNEVVVYPTLFEADDCWMWKYECGDLGWAAKELSFDMTGGPKSYTFVISSTPVAVPQVVWEGTVKSTFVP